jgi:hypothetical protein
MPCGWPSLDRHNVRLLGWSRDGRLYGVEWLGLGRAYDTLSKVNPIFDTFCVRVHVVVELVVYKDHFTESCSLL